MSHSPDEQALKQALRQLEQDQPLPPDVSQQVSRLLGQQPRPGRWGYVLVQALLLLVLLLAGGHYLLGGAG